MAKAGQFEKTVKHIYRALVEVAKSAAQSAKLGFTGRSVQSHGFMPGVPGSGAGTAAGGGTADQPTVAGGDPIDTSPKAGTDEQYVVMALSASLESERQLIGGTALTLVDGGAGSTATLNLDDTAVTPAAYTNTNLTVDQQGRITAAASGTAGTITGSGTDNHLMRWDGTGAAQDSGWVCADTDKVTVADGALDLAQPAASTVTTGNVLKVVRDLALASTDSPVVEIVQDNAGDDKTALYIKQDGNVTALSSLTVSTVSGTAAVLGSSSGVSGANFGVRGDVSSTDNAAYGGSFDQTYCGLYADFDEGAAPAAAPTGDVRIYAKTGGLMYAQDDGTGPGIHKLSNIATVQAKTIPYTALTDDDVITMDATATARTVTLYTGTGNVGRTITIIKIDSSVNAVTIDASGAETINGATTYDLKIQGESVTLVATTATTWWII